MIPAVRVIRSLGLAWVLCAMGFAGARGETFSIGPKDFLLDGKPFQIRCGEMHFARIPREYWAHRLRMARAMGLNTVCAYSFWNLHEPEPGKFNFTGNADVAEFCRLAQAEGLHVILRPGPYSCAEWDFGGQPWWLLKEKTPVKLRSRDPHYLGPARRYLDAVGRELAPLQVTRGGPILMVQVENEYGSFGNDKEYMGAMRDAIRGAGFEVPLFTCDGPKELANDTRADLFCVVNVSSEPEKQLNILRSIRAEGPLMIGEYYPGWFDSWGLPHHTGGTDKIARELGWMLDHNVSFSIYMVHGGTTFGFDAGADFHPDFLPDATTYDYDAPISEAGWATPKYQALRTLFSAHLDPGEKLPDVPAPNPVIAIPVVEFPESAPLWSNLSPATKRRHPLAMELMDQAHGAVLYRNKLKAGEGGLLRFNDLHDYGIVYLNGEKIGVIDRRLKQSTVPLPARTNSAVLEVLVDSFGHINYSHQMGDRKGITHNVMLETAASTNELTGWKMFKIPMDENELSGLKYAPGAAAGPAFYRGHFNLERAGDTFLDVGAWGKGVVWVNGHNLGRYWNIGPQRTLYCPGPWLKTGANEIVVFETEGGRHGSMPGLATPILDLTAAKTAAP